MEAKPPTFSGKPVGRLWRIASTQDRIVRIGISDVAQSDDDRIRTFDTLNGVERLYPRSASQAALRLTAGGDAVLDDALHCGDTVTPVDFLAFGVGTSRVGDPYFPDSPASRSNLCRHFGFYPEPVLFQVDALDDLATERLVAGLHIGEIEIGEHVREQREDPIAHGVPAIG